MAGILRNRYRRIDSKQFRILQGAMSEVFVAIDTGQSSQPKCFVKRLKLENLSPVKKTERLELFKREIEFLKTLNGCSGHVPKFVDAFTDKGEHYLVMEFIEGTPLSKLLKTNPLNEETTRRFLVHMLRILKEIHSHGIIHQDIKPANIMLRDDEVGPAVVDFGIARHKDGDNRGVPPTATKAFAPQEQKEGHPEFNSDIFALANTTVYMLTGVHPSHIESPFIGRSGWRRLVPNIDAGLADILDRALQTRSIHRYLTADEMLQEVERNNNRTARNRKAPEVIKPPAIVKGHSPQPPVVGKPTRQPRTPMRIRSRLAVVTIRRITTSVVVLAVVAGGLSYALRGSTMEAARSNFNNKDYVGAITELTGVLAHESQNPDALLLRARSFYEIRNYQRAAADFEQFHLLQPNNPQGYLESAESHRWLCECDSAYQNLTKLLALNSSEAAGYETRGSLLLAQGKPDDALRDYKRMSEIDRTDPSGFLYQANIFAKKGDLKAVLENYNNAIETGRADPLVRFEKGRLLHEMSKYDDAILEYQAYLKLRGNDWAAFYNIASCHHAKRRYTDALDALAKAIGTDSEQPKSYYLSGLIKHDKNDHEGAITDFNRFLEMTKQNKQDRASKPSPTLPPLTPRCACYPASASSDHISDSDKAESEEDSSREVEAHYYRGISLMKQGNSAAAKVDFEFVQSNGDESFRQLAIEELKIIAAKQ